jgi:hypothetical protein
VFEYVEQFAELVDQLTAYRHATDQLYFTMHFIDGLKNEIRAIVLVQRPKDLDTTYTLSLLQEEVAIPHVASSRKSDQYNAFKSVPRTSLPLPPPPRIDKPPNPVFPEEKRLCEGKPMEEKWAALKAFRRAKGLCIKCAEKWNKDHTCAPAIQLHALQEVLELFCVEDQEETASVHSQPQLYLMLFAHAVNGTEGSKTTRLKGSIQGKYITILIDSGSSHTFLSEQLALQFSGIHSLNVVMGVQVANGEKLSCTKCIPVGQWQMGVYAFSSNLKLLPLHHYDMIVGMDWLESHSPMKVHWKNKWMVVPYNGSKAFLQGIIEEAPPKVLAHLSAMFSELAAQTQQAPPEEIASLLQEFDLVFASPFELLPQRDCDHVIPLVPGPKPVYIKPYRYPPSLKDEIEKQVVEMLAKGLIQPSVSAFSSPILLVKKKDGTWRFCVDYRYLNALTLKSKFPIPVFDELIDELAKARWFTTLDLNVGYHHIRLKLGEEFKTTFQTHFSHFEFTFMAFGLCGAPGTFQGAMNQTLAPLLRKCVVVFFDDILTYSATFDEHD